MAARGPSVRRSGPKRAGARASGLAATSNVPAAKTGEGHSLAPTRKLASLSGPDLHAMISAATDIVLLIEGGVIQDVGLGSEDLVREGCNGWIGRRWIDTVTIESRPKVKELLANPSGRGRQREINHVSPHGPDVPLRYAVIRIGESGAVLAMGRDLRTVVMLQQRLVETQQAMEREYARIRLAETRYRMLFHMGTEPIVIVDAATSRVVEANPAAQKLIAGPAGFPPSAPLLGYFDANGADAMAVLLKAGTLAGRSDDTQVTVAATDQPFLASASVFQQDRSNFLLVRFAPQTVAGASEPRGALPHVAALLEQFPDGFVVVDPQMKIIEANQTFIDLAQLSSKSQAIGHDLGRWLGRAGIDMPRLVSTLAEHGSVRMFPTIVRGAFGIVEEVEISAVSSLNAEMPVYGFVIRSTAARAAVDTSGARGLPRSVEQMTELVGRVSLKDLVRETTDVIERLCIEAALDLSNDNRASAAQMLGLSRQSLYAKLRRHGLGGLDEGTDIGSGMLS